MQHGKGGSWPACYWVSTLAHALKFEVMGADMNKTISRKIVFLSCFLGAAAGLPLQLANAQTCPNPSSPDRCPPTQTGAQAPPPAENLPSKKLNVDDAVKIIGGLLKKKQPVDQPATTPSTGATPPKQDIVFVPSKEVANPKAKQVPVPVRDKQTAISAAKPANAVALGTLKNASQPKKSEVAAPRVSNTVISAAAAAADVEAPALATPPAPATDLILKPDPQDNNSSGPLGFYLILGAIAAALAAIALTVKAMLAPKVSIACTLEPPKSAMVTSPSITIPDITFKVVIPGHAVSAPLGL
jgi:hypothetical protein